MPVPRAPTAKVTRSGLLLPDLSWTAACLGLVPVSDGWLDTAVAAYVTASDYLVTYERMKGRDFDADAWSDALLRMFPREEYVQVLAWLNRATPFKEVVREHQGRFLAGLAPDLRAVLQAALDGVTDGQPRWFLARQPVLRAIRLVLTTELDEGPRDGRIVEFLDGIGIESAAVLLVHLAADALAGQRPEDEPKLGGSAESLAIEVVCNQLFNESQDVGGLIARTWALWTHYGNELPLKRLPKAPLDLLEDATGLTLAEMLALGFAYWVKTTENRINGPVRIDAFALVRIPRDRVERFLMLFSTTVEELTSDLRACEQPWQMLPLQSRPLLRLGDEIVVLDERFLWEAVTTGLFWRVSAQLRKDEPDGWQAWAQAYGDMIEVLAEDLIKAIAPIMLDGSSVFFTEEDIKTAFATKRQTPSNSDAGIDFTTSVTLFEVVNKAMTLAARTGNIDAFKDDVEQAVLKKTGQLDRTAELLRRDPQPAASPLREPATTIFPIVVCGNHFPLNPVTRKHVQERLREDGILHHEDDQPLAIIDLDELESFASLARAGHLLPEVLADWLGGEFAKGSFTIYLSATHGGTQMKRPPEVQAMLTAAFGAINPLLNAVDDRSAEPG